MFDRKIGCLMLSVLLTSGTMSVLAQDPEADKELSDELVAVLKSDASREEKAAACRQLARVATKDAVAPLAALLGDAELSHMARYALEPITDPSVDDALRAALAETKGRQLIGVVGSLGVRRDAKAVEPMAKLLKSDDPALAQATAKAMGSIGTSAAAKALIGAMAESSGQQTVAICEGLLRCADSMAATNQREEAIAIYDRLRGEENPPHVQTGALQGAILAREKDGLSILAENLRSKNYAMFAAACQAGQNLKAAQATQTLTDSLAGLSADHQVVVIQSLGKRADPAAVDALVKSAKSGEKPVRLAAIRGLAAIGDVGAAPVLSQLSKDADADLAKAAEQSLASLHAKPVKSQE